MAKKSKRSIPVVKKKSIAKVTNNAQSNRFLLVIGAVIAVILVLLATLLVNQSKLEVKNSDELNSRYDISGY